MSKNRVPNRDWLPHREQDLVGLMDVWQLSLADTENQNNYGWPAAACTALLEDMAAFLAARVVYREAPTTVNRLEKDGKKAAAIESMRVFARDNIRSNPKMTDPQKAALGVTIRDMDPSPAVIPGAGPGSVVLNRDKSPGFVIIRYLGGRPAGVIACEIRFGILGAAPANVEDLLEMDTFTHNPWKRAFPLSDRGGKFFFALRWIVSGGAKSPWTEIRECIIP